jgi:hypothetical protein
MLPFLASIPAGVPYLPFVGFGYDRFGYDRRTISPTPDDGWTSRRRRTTRRALGVTPDEYQDYFYRIWCTYGGTVTTTPWRMLYRVPNIPLQVQFLDTIFNSPSYVAPVDIARMRYYDGKRDQWYFVRTANAAAETPCDVYGSAPILSHESLPATAFETRTVAGVPYVAVKDAAAQTHAHGSLVGWKSTAHDDVSAEAEPYQGTGPTDLTADMYRIVKAWKQAGHGVGIVPPAGWATGMDLMRWYETDPHGVLRAYALEEVEDAAIVAGPDVPGHGFVLYEPVGGWKSGGATTTADVSTGVKLVAAAAFLGIVLHSWHWHRHQDPLRGGRRR